ncbi:MAG: hypothetical protein EP349_01335 [Alphaproteobacteria bacterium]|nr:MAG: hypothetical protein EP349_01335 [Alphaproteobacteria bacterium]
MVLEKAGKALKSTGGGIAYYTALAAIPLSALFALNNDLPDYNDGTNADSQAAVAEYTAESQGMMGLYNSIAALKEASAQQDTPDDVIAFQNRIVDIKRDLITQGDALEVKILNDARLTEQDYRFLNENLEIEGTEYVALPSGERYLDEARTAAQGENAADKAPQIVQALIDYDNGRFGAVMLSILIGLVSVVGGIGGFVGSGASEDLRKSAANGLIRAGQKRRSKPQH